MGFTRLKSRRKLEQGSKYGRVAIAILSTIGAIDTGAITFNKWGLLGSLSCPGGANGCEKVLNSPWGILFENESIIIPLSFLGLISYLAILVMAIIPFILEIKENKGSFIRKTWWGLFSTSCAMSIFSIVLMGIMVFKIKAFCLFCLFSSIISISILLISIIGGSWDSISELLFKGMLLSLPILLGSLIWSANVDPSIAIDYTNLNGNPPQVKSISSSAQIRLAKHLRSRNIIMYSAYWCPHCHEQKELFGEEASKELLVVECAKDGINSKSELCDQKKIDSYPSWEINGEIKPGVRSLEELSEISNFNNLRLN